MARPLRLEYAGALYHVTARGDRNNEIYEDDDDRHAFLSVLARVTECFNWLVHAYCLMDNHYHLLVETPGGNLAKGMRQLNGMYTQYSNRRHERSGHLFQGRYKAILVQKESYLLEVARHVVLNPVRAQRVRSAGDWPWSSYRATAGRRDTPAWLMTDWILSAFAEHREDAVLKYRRFVSQGRGQPAPWQALANQVLLGDAHFIGEMQTRLTQQNRDLAEIPRHERPGRARPLANYVTADRSRDESIARAYASGGYSMSEIGAYFRLHYSTVSRIIKTQEARGAAPD